MTRAARVLPRFVPALLAALVASACNEAESQSAPSAPAVRGEQVVFAPGSPQLAVFQTTTIDGASERKLVLPGRLVWDETRTTRIYAPVAGRIVRLFATASERVEKDQTLALLASPEWGQAQSEARRAKADLALAEKNVARARELDAAGVIAKRDLHAAEADLERAQAEYARTSTKLRAYGTADEVDQMFPLRSPIAGVVVDRNANVGQEFRPDQAGAGAPPLFVVSDPTHLWAQLEAPETAIGIVRRGQTIRLRTAIAPAETMRAKIDFVADALDPQARTLKLRASIPNPAQRLKAEMFVNAEVDLPDDGASIVPASGVVLVDNRHYVFIDAGDGKFERRVVEAEDAGVERMRVRSGLRRGEKIVTAGALFLEQIIDGQSR